MPINFVVCCNGYACTVQLQVASYHIAVEGLLGIAFAGIMHRPLDTPQHDLSCTCRSLDIKTTEFGKKWGTLAYEKKLKLSPSSIKTPASFMETIKKLNFQPVEIIGI